MYYFSTYVKQLRDIRKYNCIFEYWDANILQVACVPYKFACKIKKKSYRRVLIYMPIIRNDSIRHTSVQSKTNTKTDSSRIENSHDEIYINNFLCLYVPV